MIRNLLTSYNSSPATPLPFIHWSFFPKHTKLCPSASNTLHLSQIFDSSLLKYHLLREAFLDYPT